MFIDLSQLIFILVNHCITESDSITVIGLVMMAINDTGDLKKTVLVIHINNNDERCKSSTATK